MSFEIAQLITKLTGDFETNGWTEPEAFAESCAHCAVDPKSANCFLKIWAEQGKVAPLIQRYLEQEVGEFQVEDRTAQKMTTLKATRFVGQFGREWYNTWHGSEMCGHLKLAIVKQLSPGVYESLRRPTTLDLSEILALSPNGARYLVRVSDLQAYNNTFGGGSLRGTGSGLMQIAAEVCQQHFPGDHRSSDTLIKIEAIVRATLGCVGLYKDIQGVCLGYLGYSSQQDYGINILLHAHGNSPGFFRTVRFTPIAHREEIDAELAKAKQEKYKPDTSSWQSFMYLDDAGRAYFAQKILESPILSCKGLFFSA